MSVKFVNLRNSTIVVPLVNLSTIVVPRLKDPVLKDPVLKKK